MFRKIFFAAIVCVLALSAQIAAAQVDWNSVPRFDNKADLARHIEDGRRNGQSVFSFVLTYFTLSPDQNAANKEILELEDSFANGIAMALTSDLVGDLGTGQFTYTIQTEYPGTHVVTAYLRGDTSTLTSDELQLYNAALPIVNDAQKLSTPLEKEIYIHNAICNRAKFYLEEPMFTADHKPKRFTTALGAILDGKANCGGFTDAFYMIGRMCGLNVGKMAGTAKIGDHWESHAWNTITFDDGKTYCVDVTNGVNMKNLHLFNAPYDVLRETHKCQWDALPNLQRTVDNRYGLNLK